MRSRRPARHLRLLPGGEVFVELGERLVRFCFEALDLVGDRHVAARLHGAQLLDLLFEFADRLFEIEVGAHRASDMGMQSGNCRGAAKLAAAGSQVKETDLFRFPPADAGRAPGFSVALPAHACRSAWSRCPRGRAMSAPSEDPRRSATDDL